MAQAHPNGKICDPDSLGALIAPLTEEQFLELLRKREFAFTRGGEADRFTSLVNWETLNQLLESGAYPLSSLHVLREGSPLFAALYTTKGKIDIPSLSRHLDAGLSLVFNGLEDFVPRLKRLCERIERRVGDEVTAGAIVTSGSGGAFKIHFDPEDLLILQISGQKRWLVYDKPVLNPTRPMPASVAAGVPVFDEVLTPGDWMLLPAGHWHRCENGPGRSLHAGIFINPATGLDLIKGWTTGLAADEVLRRPLTRIVDTTALAAHEAALKARLIEWVGQISVTDFLSRASAARKSRIRLDLAGRDEIADHDVISDCFRRRPNLPPCNGIWGGEIELNGKKCVVDPAEHRILDLLSKQERMPFAELVAELSAEMPRGALVEAIQKLRSNGLINID
jgi:hypothetical protein